MSAACVLGGARLVAAPPSEMAHDVSSSLVKLQICFDFGELGAPLSDFDKGVRLAHSLQRDQRDREAERAQSPRVGRIRSGWPSVAGRRQSSQVRSRRVILRRRPLLLPRLILRAMAVVRNVDGLC